MFAFSRFCEDDTSSRFGEGYEHDEDHNQIGARNTHGFGYVGTHVYASEGKRNAGCSFGSVPCDSWCVGNLRLTVCETEMSANVYEVCKEK